MNTNTTIKNDIKAMLLTASNESGISYMDLLNYTRYSKRLQYNYHTSNRTY